MDKYNLLCIIYLTSIIAKPHISPSTNRSIMSYEEYATVRHATPYMFKLENNKQRLFYFGANHACDPHDPQYAALETFWQEFLDKTEGRPRIVLVEGNTRRLTTNKEEAITTAGGEGGYITFLAHQENIPVVCPEPQKSRLVRELLKQFTIEEILYRDFAQSALQACRYRQIHGTSFDHEAFIADCLADFSYFFTTCFYARTFTMGTIQEIHHRHFDHELDLYDKTFFATITDPAAQHCIINKICRQASMLRDKAIVDYIRDEITNHKNIFVVYGATHAVMQEEAISILMKTQSK